MADSTLLTFGENTRLFVENEKIWDEQRAQSRQIEGDLSAHIIKHGVVLPIRPTSKGPALGGVTYADGGYVPNSQHLQSAVDLTSSGNVIGGYGLEESPVKHGGTAVFAGGGQKSGAFGHFLIEDLSRLWYLFAEPERREHYIVFNNTQLTLNDAGFRLLELAGIPLDRVVIVERPTSFDTVIVPDQSMFLHPGSAHFTESRRIYDTIRDSVKPGSYEKIYLTYRQMNRTQLSLSVNEEMLEDLYIRNGFTVIAPEKLGMAEQISAISGAKEIACTAGTLSHLVAFAQDDTKLDVFIRDKIFMPEIQWSLNEMRAARVDVVDTLLPLISGNARRGVIYFTSTPQWAEFAKRRFNSIEPSQPPESYAASYLTEWARLLGNSKRWALDLMPEWRASDLVESLYKVLLPDTPLADEQSRGLRRRFYADERRISDLQSELNTKRDAVRALSGRLSAIESSLSWRLTNPLRTAVRIARRSYRRLHFGGRSS